MKTNNPISIISEIGNYALPAFSAFLTAFFAIGKLNWVCDKDRYLIIIFSAYTILSTFVAYIHRLLWLRHQNKYIFKDEKPKDLSNIIIFIILIVHAVLIYFLCMFLYKYCFM